MRLGRAHDAAADGWVLSRAGATTPASATLRAAGNHGGNRALRNGGGRSLDEGVAEAQALASRDRAACAARASGAACGSCAACVTRTSGAACVTRASGAA